MPDTSAIHFTVVDGRRELLPAGTTVLVRLLNGAKTINPKFATGGDIRIGEIPFTDTDDDAYHVFVHADGYEDAVTPMRVPLKQNKTVEVALMATPSGGKFHFQPWDEFKNVDSRILKLVTNGAPGDPAKRYSDTFEAHNLELGSLLTIATAIKDIPLKNNTSALDTYYWEVIWDLLAPDRFWAWVDARLADRIQELADIHAVASEPDAAHWHKGIPGLIDPATRQEHGVPVLDPPVTIE